VQHLASLPWRWLLFGWIFLCAGAASAHSQSTAYLAIIDGDSPTLTARIALRDLDAMLDLDRNGDGHLTWGEVDDRRADIGRWISAGLRLSRGNAPCVLEAGAPAFIELAGAGYLQQPFTAGCPGDGPLALDYRLFAGIDPAHRVLVSSSDSKAPRLLTPGERFETAAPPEGFAGFFADGARHIVGGPDHLLFLVALLLPAVLRRQGGRWVAVPSLGAALVQVLWIVTAFTIAHSITLAASVLGWLRIPATIIEPLIAVTVLLAALNNLYPLLQRRLALIAFGFGLIHGFGLAEVLLPLELAAGELARALLAFNLGIEAGQLLIVAIAFTLLAALRGWSAYPRWVLGGGSAAVALIACGWIAERVFDLSVFG